MIIETHCHLDYLKQAPLEEILQKSREAGVEKIVTISVEPNNLDEVIEIANNNDEIYFSQGIHPHNAKDCDQVDFDKISKRCKNKIPKLIAVGEIGLDYHYDNSPRDIQREVFEKHLQLAIDSNLPVIIHTREADDDTISILKNFSPQMKKKGVLHSFTSTPKLAEFALTEGFSLGFNGIITFKKAQDVRDIVALTPINQILFETDAPFLTPTPHRGKENAPFYLPHIIEKIAEIKNEDINSLKETVYNNSVNLFGL